MKSLIKAVAILCKKARVWGQDSEVMKYALKGVSSQGSSELCMELGHYFYNVKDWEEAAIWYYNAAYETPCQMSLKAATSEPLSRLISCYENLGLQEVAEEYKKQLENLEK